MIHVYWDDCAYKLKLFSQVLNTMTECCGILGSNGTFHSQQSWSIVSSSSLDKRQ